MSNKVVIVSGPTASGKSSYAIELAQCIDGEIISCDSMQVYKGLDIGTAKVTLAEQMDIPHYLLDICLPNETYSVADFQEAAREKIADIQGRGKVPILVGGTGLYIQATVFDYVFEELETLDYERYQALSNESILNRLQAVDKESYQKIEHNNRRRLIHALALGEQTAKTKSQREQAQNQTLLYDVFPIALMPARELLYERINQRVEQMINLGLLAEVAFFNNKYQLAPQIRQAIGYKEPLAYFSGELSSKKAMVEKIQQNTRQFAKRQMTWIRNQKIAYNYLCTEADKSRIEQALFQFLQK